VSVRVRTSSSSALGRRPAFFTTGLAARVASRQWLAGCGVRRSWLNWSLSVAVEPRRIVMDDKSGLGS
jgi:hypothetical protein